MKLVLASAGFSTPVIVDTCSELVGKPAGAIDVAVINEAYAVEDGDHSWVLNDLNAIKDNFKSFHLVNLLALSIDEIKQSLDKADVIFVSGGHTDYLMNVLVKTKLAKLMPDLLRTKVYVGSSAGAMIIGKRVSTYANKEIYDEEAIYGGEKYLELVDLAILPHLDNPAFPNNRESELARICNGHNGVVYALRDDAAIVFDGDKTYNVGSPPVEA